MNSHENKREASYEQMLEESIKSQLEKNGTMSALRSEMHVKVLRLLRGQQDMTKPKVPSGEAAKLNKAPSDRNLIKLINQLVMEFFNWFGYKHTLETFRMETGDDMAIRSDLEARLFITPDSPDLPLLAQLVIRDWKSNLAPKTRLVVPENVLPERSLKLQEKFGDQLDKKEMTGKKLIQNNQKLIANDPLRKAVALKQMRSPRPPLMTKKADQKVSVASSESDILDSDYSEESEDSDAYATIPDRHVFEDDLPPEGKYNPGHGEEGAGPYDAKQSLAKSLYQQYQELNTDDIPSSSHNSVITIKGFKKGKKMSKAYEGSESEDKSSGSGKQVKTSSIRPQICGNNRPNLANDPETHIGSMDFDSDDSFSDEASG